MVRSGRRSAFSGCGRRGGDLGALAKRNRDGALLASRSAKAELDLQRTRVLAPARGLVTDLRTEVGQFAQAGAPAMTLITIHDFWINADLTENNLGNVDAGDEVAIVLDVWPGEVFKGRVRSVGSGVSSGKQTSPGALPTIENSRDWLRQAQRFPVAVEFDPGELMRTEISAKFRLAGVRDELEASGLQVVGCWTDGAGDYALTLARSGS